VFFALLQGEGQESERLDFCKKNNLLLQPPEKNDTVYTASHSGRLGPEEDSCKDVDNRYNPSRDIGVL
jgi:hypothetical protein